MFPASKSVSFIHGTGVTNGGTGTATFDRLGFDFLEIDTILGTSNNTTNNPTVLKLAESAITDATGFSNISGFVGGTDFTVGASLTSLENTYRFNVDCRGRQRYLKVSVSPVTTQLVIFNARMHKGDTMPTDTNVGGCRNYVSG